MQCVAKEAIIMIMVNKYVTKPHQNTRQTRRWSILSQTLYTCLSQIQHCKFLQRIPSPVAVSLHPSQPKMWLAGSIIHHSVSARNALDCWTLTCLRVESLGRRRPPQKSQTSGNEASTLRGYTSTLTWPNALASAVLEYEKNCPLSFLVGLQTNQPGFWILALSTVFLRATLCVSCQANYPEDKDPAWLGPTYPR